MPKIDKLQLVICTILITFSVMGNCSQAQERDSPIPMWIFFKDKGLDQFEIEVEKGALNSTFNSKSLQRRRNMGLPASVDLKDLRVNPNYINEILEMEGVQLRHVSRWLNAISVDVINLDANIFTEKHFVSHINEVRQFYRYPEFETENFEFHQIEDDQLEDPQRDWNLEYGRSLRQNLFLNAPRLHDFGITGDGIIIGVLDAGFDNLDHNCFANIDILDSWDFVNDDDEVGDEDDMGRGSHGTKTLSIIGGYEEDTFVGIAFDATFILGKTENTDWERPVEEDHWVAGIEWMDELGVEIVSSSLSYFDWYDYEDMDGETGVTTVVAQRAVGIGIIICTSMGNSGMADYPLDKMGAPADGIDVYSIGAVSRDSSFAAWSSQGPTFDGRIKPDFTTIGSGVYFAGSNNNQNYGSGLGTSFSAPAIAGLCALLLQANPYLNPISMRDILRNASNNNEEPDTLLGWGIPDGFAALEAIGFEQTELEIPLERGWSIISHNLETNIFDIRELVSELVDRDNLILIKDGRGRFYSPENDFNNIPFWNHLEGYQILVAEEDELIIEGIGTSYTQPIELMQGWQIISYLPTFQMDAEVAFHSLSDNNNLILVKDDHGRFYFPLFGFSNMLPCREGSGYLINLVEDDVLIYPRQRLVDANYTKYKMPKVFILPEPEENGMSILILVGEGILTKDEIAFLSQDGKVIGSGVVSDSKCGIALWGGSKKAELPLVQLFSIRNQQTSTIELTKIYGTSGYAPNGIAVYQAEPGQLLKTNISDEGRISLHPNPFNQTITIRLGNAPEKGSRLIIFDNQGRQVYNELWKNSGYRQKILNSNDWTSGTYFFKLKSGGESYLGSARHIK